MVDTDAAILADPAYGKDFYRRASGPTLLWTSLKPKDRDAVRIKHIPTGINIKVAQERSQAQNRDIALKRLKRQLLAIANEQRLMKIKLIRGEAVEAAWGAQIRNYVLHAYKMVKDQRTNWETTDTNDLLDGDLEDCKGSLLR